MATDAVADEARHTKVHGFVYGESPRFIKSAGWKHEQIGQEVARRHLGLVGERQKVNAGSRRSGGASNETGFLFAVTDENENRIPRPHGEKRLKQRERLLGRNQFAGEEHDPVVWREAECGTERVGGREMLRVGEGEARSIDGMRREMETSLGNAQGEEIIPVGRADRQEAGESGVEKPK